MGFLGRFFDKKRVKKVINETLTDLNTRPGEEIFEGLQEPITGTLSTVEQMSVTDRYAIVALKMEDAVEEKRKVRNAAKRLIDAIGVGPDTKKSSSQNS